MKIPALALLMTQLLNLADCTNRFEEQYGNSDKASLDAPSNPDLVEMLVPPGSNGVVDTCVLQNEVIQWSITRHTPNLCGFWATFQVCLTLRLTKDRTSIGKTCIKASDAVHLPDFEDYNNSYYKDSHVGMALGDEYYLSAQLSQPDYPTTNNSVQCQLGCGGDTLYFSLLDGARCKPDSRVTSMPDYAHSNLSAPITNSRVDFTCKSRSGWNNNNVGEHIGTCLCADEEAECVWKVGLPTDPFEVSPEPSPSSSPSPACFCPPESDKCKDESTAAYKDGKTEQVDLMNCGNPSYVADALKTYGCKVSQTSCPTVICDQFVPPKEIDALAMSTCPIPSPSPEKP